MVWGEGINNVLKRNPTNCCFLNLFYISEGLFSGSCDTMLNDALYSTDGFKWETFNLIMHSTWKRRRTLNWSAPRWWRTAKCTRTAWIQSWCNWRSWNVSGTRLSTNVFLVMALNQFTSCYLRATDLVLLSSSHRLSNQEMMPNTLCLSAWLTKTSTVSKYGSWKRRATNFKLKLYAKKPR